MDFYDWSVPIAQSGRKSRRKTSDENLDRLATVQAKGNRFTLARVPLDGEAKPVATYQGLSAARLKGDVAGNALTEELRSDPWPRAVVNSNLIRSLRRAGRI